MGDLSKQIEVDARGEILDLKNTVNGMVVRCVNRFPRLVLFRSSSTFPRLLPPPLCPEALLAFLILERLGLMCSFLHDIQLTTQTSPL